MEFITWTITIWTKKLTRLLFSSPFTMPPEAIPLERGVLAYTSGVSVDKETPQVRIGMQTITVYSTKVFIICCAKRFHIDPRILCCWQKCHVRWVDLEVVSLVPGVRGVDHGDGGRAAGRADGKSAFVVWWRALAAEFDPKYAHNFLKEVIAISISEMSMQILKVIVYLAKKRLSVKDPLCFSRKGGKKDCCLMNINPVYDDIALVHITIVSDLNRDWTLSSHQ